MSNGNYNRHKIIPPSSENIRPDKRPDIENPQENQETQHLEPKAKMFIRIIGFLVIAVCAAFIVRDTLFSIDNCLVVGNKNIPSEIILSSAGISASSNYFNIDEKQIEKGINSNRYLQYVGMEKRFPNGLTIHVKERIPAACINYIGIKYIIADDGLVLETTKNDNIENSLAVISGLEIQDINVGAMPQLRKSSQLAACVQLIQELIMQGAINNIKSISFADGSIYLSTRDGYNVNLGTGDYLRAKIGTVRGVLEELQKQNILSGIIEATIPGEATYRPEN
jgi:cell division septal protein FtsQ